MLGVVFGPAVTDDDTGYVLTLNEVHERITAAPSSTVPVATGPCVLS